MTEDCSNGSTVFNSAGADINLVGTSGNDVLTGDEMQPLSNSKVGIKSNDFILY
jgi:hypothetical protein